MTIKQYFICDWWFNVDCALTESLYTRNDEIAAAAAGIDASNKASNNNQGSGNGDSGFNNNRETGGNRGNGGNIGNGGNRGTGGNGGKGAGGSGGKGGNQGNRPSSVGSGYGSPVEDYDGDTSISDNDDSSPLTSYRIPNYWKFNGIQIPMRWSEERVGTRVNKGN